MRPDDAARPLRIGLVSREHPAWGASGGIGTYTEDLARGLAARGHAVTVLARGQGTEALEGPPAGSPRLVAVDVAAAWAPPGLGRVLGMTARTVPFALGAGRLAGGLGPFDVVEVPEYQGWGLGVALTARCPVVVRLHGHTALVRRQNGDALDLDARVCGFLEAATLRRATRVTVGSACLAAEARRDFPGVLGRSRLTVLPLGIDTRHFSPGRSQGRPGALRLPVEAPVLLYVGRLERRKGVEVLLEAFIRLRSRHPEAVLVLAGGDPPPGSRPPLREALLQRAREAGVATGLRLPGPLPRATLPALYGACDLFVGPSAAEPFGLVFLEAMACGKPVVGCRSGGVPEIVQEGRTGWLVPPDDAEALAARMSEALDSPGWCHQVGREARARVEERFSLGALVARTEAEYRAAFAERSEAPPKNAGRQVA